jgi:hypothetical protein
MGVAQSDIGASYRALVAPIRAKPCVRKSPTVLTLSLGGGRESRFEDNSRTAHHLKSVLESPVSAALFLAQARVMVCVRCTSMSSLILNGDAMVWLGVVDTGIDKTAYLLGVSM